MEKLKPAFQTNKCIGEGNDEQINLTESVSSSKCSSEKTQKFVLCKSLKIDGSQASSINQNTHSALGNSNDNSLTQLFDNFEVIKSLINYAFTVAESENHSELHRLTGQIIKMLENKNLMMKKILHYYQNDIEVLKKVYEIDQYVTSQVNLLNEKITLCLSNDQSGLASETSDTNTEGQLKAEDLTHNYKFEIGKGNSVNLTYTNDTIDTQNITPRSVGKENKVADQQVPSIINSIVGLIWFGIKVVLFPVAVGYSLGTLPFVVAGYVLQVGIFKMMEYRDNFNDSQWNICRGLRGKDRLNNDQCNKDSNLLKMHEA